MWPGRISMLYSRNSQYLTSRRSTHPWSRLTLVSCVMLKVPNCVYSCCLCCNIILLQVLLVIINLHESARHFGKRLNFIYWNQYTISIFPNRPGITSTTHCSTMSSLSCIVLHHIPSPLSSVSPSPNCAVCGLSLGI